MGMTSAGGSASGVSEINVTPLIDVLLVLLIIFMVIVPVAPHGLEALVPQPASKAAPEQPDRPVVVQVLGSSSASATFKINEEPYAKADLPARLLQIFAARQSKILFIKGSEDVEYGEVAGVIDAAHHAGVESIGILTAKVEAGQ